MTDILHAAYSILATSDAPQLFCQHMEDPNSTYLDFNFSTTGCDPLLGDFFRASDTRPLNIVNSDNRILANAVRKCIEPILERFISHHQRGFLPGRSMLANIIDIDHESTRVSLLHDHGCALHFEFSEAFPSLSHTFLHTSLRHLNFPDHSLGLLCRVLTRGP